MTIDRIREVLSKQPFEPFAIHLPDGREIRVTSREFVSISPAGRTLHVFQDEKHAHYIDLLLVTSISTGFRSGRRRRAS